MSVGSSDLGWALWMIGGFLLVLIVVSAVVAWFVRRRGSRTAVISVTLTIAAWWVALFVIGTPIAIVQTLASASVWVPDAPVSIMWPDPLPCGTDDAGTAPYLECASTPSANLTIVGLSIAPRLLLAAGQLLGNVLLATPAAVIAILCFQLLRGRPFSRLAVRVLLIAAFIVLVAGIGVDIVTGIGRGLAAAEVLPAEGDGATSSAAFNLTVQLWPIGAALGLAALAAVFRYGFTLQRETEGLV